MYTQNVQYNIGEVMKKEKIFFEESFNYIPNGERVVSTENNSRFLVKGFECDADGAKNVKAEDNVEHKDLHVNGSLGEPDNYGLIITNLGFNTAGSETVHRVSFEGWLHIKQDDDTINACNLYHPNNSLANIKVKISEVNKIQIKKQMRIGDDSWGYFAKLENLEAEAPSTDIAMLIINTMDTITSSLKDHVYVRIIAKQLFITSEVEISFSGASSVNDKFALPPQK